MTELIVFTEADLKRAAEAERICFSVPWSEQSLRLLTKAPAYGLVLLADRKFAAYGGILCIADEAQLLNIATLPEFRRCGYARLLLDALIAEAKRCGAVNMYLEVRESNTAAKRLYESTGFAAIGMRKDYYTKPREAAIIMEKKL